LAAGVLNNPEVVPRFRPDKRAKSDLVRALGRCQGQWAALGPFALDQFRTVISCRQTRDKRDLIVAIAADSSLLTLWMLLIYLCCQSGADCISPRLHGSPRGGPAHPEHNLLYGVVRAALGACESWQRFILRTRRGKFWTVSGVRHARRR
jgi:hypothetical protein